MLQALAVSPFPCSYAPLALKRGRYITIYEHGT